MSHSPHLLLFILFFFYLSSPTYYSISFSFLPPSLTHFDSFFLSYSLHHSFHPSFPSHISSFSFRFFPFLSMSIFLFTLSFFHSPSQSTLLHLTLFTSLHLFHLCPPFIFFPLIQSLYLSQSPSPFLYLPLSLSTFHLFSFFTLFLFSPVPDLSPLPSFPGPAFLFRFLSFYPFLPLFTSLIFLNLNFSIFILSLLIFSLNVSITFSPSLAGSSSLSHFLQFLFFLHFPSFQCHSVFLLFSLPPHHAISFSKFISFSCSVML